MHDPQTRNPAEAATTARAISQANFNICESIETPLTLQQQKVRRLYAVSFATAATIARLAYAVAQ
jgi:hypothetical protein